MEPPVKRSGSGPAPPRRRCRDGTAPVAPKPREARFRRTPHQVSVRKRTVAWCYKHVNSALSPFGSLTRVSRRLAVMAHYDYRGGVGPHVRRQVETLASAVDRLLVVSTADLTDQ